jgi:FkbM family methyltransferase
MSSESHDNPEVSGAVWTDQESAQVEQVVEPAYPITLAKTVHGFSLFTVDGDEHVGHNLREKGFWEPDVTHWLYQNIKDADTCLDIGSNVGYFTEIMARKAGSYGRVYAFEANPNLVDVYEKTLVDAGNDYESVGMIYLFPIGLSDESREAYIFVPKANIGGAGVTYDESDPLDGYESVPVVLDLITNIIDEIVIEEIDIIKMDVEGHEEKIWPTLKPVLKNVRALIVELGPYHSRDFLEEVSKDFDMFKLENFDEVPITVEDILSAPAHINTVLRKKSLVN